MNQEKLPMILAKHTKSFANAQEISEVEEDILVRKYNLNAFQLSNIKKELGELRQDNFNSYQVISIIEFWANH